MVEGYLAAYGEVLAATEGREEMDRTYPAQVAV
jgi:hypothetical protein